MPTSRTGRQLVQELADISESFIDLEDTLDENPLLRDRLYSQVRELDSLATDVQEIADEQPEDEEEEKDDDSDE